MKLCKACKAVKPPSEFYPRSDTKDGLRSTCKECWNAESAKRKQTPTARAYEKQRSTFPHRVKARKEITAKWAAAHPLQVKAEQTLNSALKFGRITKWPVCAVPECDRTRVVGHHPDYSAPLDVVWLCQAHHKQAHAIPLPLARHIARTYKLPEC